MRQFTQISFSTGHVFEVPTNVIAAHRASAMKNLHGDEFPTIEDAMRDSVELFDDEMQIRDWALNQMNWQGDLQPHARLVRYIPAPLDMNQTEWSHHDVQALVGDLAQDTVLQTPMWTLVSLLAAKHQALSAYTMPDQHGQPYAMVAIAQGGPGIVGFILGLLQQAANHIAVSQVDPATVTDQSTSTH